MNDNITTSASTTEDADLGGMDTSYPRLSAGAFDFIIESAKRNETPENDFLQLTLKTTVETKSTDGEILPIGFTTTTIVGLKPYPPATQKDTDKRLARWVQAAGLACRKSELLANPMLLSGKLVPCQVKTYTSKDGEERNSFTPIVKRP